MSIARFPPLALMLALSLTACGALSPTLKKPLPPRADCLQAKTDNPPSSPVCSPEQCAGDWLAYVVELLGGWTQERVLRKAEHKCVQRLKDAGLIR